jgi:gliding motility-associated-like protein
VKKTDCSERSPYTFLIILFLLVSSQASSQYFPNPSFEGTFPNPNFPPQNWEKCTGSPDTQPFVWDVPTEPSNGNSYVGMAWLPFWTERIWTPLLTTLKLDSCYRIRIDLAYYGEINYYGDLQTTFPIKILIRSSSSYCADGPVLWESPYIGNYNWVTHEFVVEPEEEINNITIMTYYDQVMPDEIGYILMDNIEVITPPDLDLGNDTTLCTGDTITLNAGPGFDEYLWQDGSSDSVYYATQAGVYFVEGMTYWGCSRYDTIVIEQSPIIELGEDTTICIGDTVQFSPGEGFSQYLWFNGTTDSVLQLWEVGQYLVWVSVTDSLGCTAADSLNLSIINDSTIVDLGPDTLICKGTGYTLNPGPYYEYLWQDSATTSIFIVIEPGEYSVRVLGDCGYAYDTVVVDFFPEAGLNLGPDTLVCGDVILELDAGEGFEDYLWQDGSTGQTYTVNGTGYYWVSAINEFGCQETDTIHVALSSAVVVDLGNDTTVCSGEEYVLNPGSGFASYLWQDGSSNSIFQVNSPGLYWVEVTDEMGCSGIDSVVVTLNPSPIVDLGEDTTVCSGGTVFLDPGNQFSSYLWQDNSTLPVYTVTTPGLYSVTVTNIYNCPGFDEIYVDFDSPDIELGSDTLLCLGDTIMLEPGQGYMEYLWQDSTTASMYFVTEGGIYSVMVTDEKGCTAGDAVEIEPVPKPFADLGEDTPICLGDTILLQAPEGPFTYLWNGEPGGSYLTIESGGTYALEVSNQCGTASDQVVITEYKKPEVDLGDDRILQAGDAIELDGGTGFDAYLWQDGSTGRYFLLTYENASPENPFYYVEVTDGPCKNSDTIKISLLEVKIPNVFTPNGDGVNDTFSPLEEGWSGVNRHHIEVYNRWGEMVWESDHFEAGWDGKQNGANVSDGIYFWILEIYYGEDGLAQTLKGTVTILGGNG